MNEENTNDTGNEKLPDEANEPETLLTEEAQRLLRRIRETPIETDDDLIELGRIYSE